MEHWGISILKYKWFIAGFTLLMMIIFIVGLSKEKTRMTTSEDDYIATINGIPISVTEYNRAVRMNKSIVMNDFREKYNAEQTADFWNTSYEGITPSEVLKKKALDESVNIKIRQMIAKEQGVVEDISYRGFLQQLDQENARRTKAIENHQVIYGPAQYNEDAYFEYLQTNAMLSVKQKMQTGKDKPDEQSLRDFYDTHKDELYRTTGLVKVQRISISYLKDHQTNELKKEQAKEQLKKAEAELAVGVSFKDIAKAVSDIEAEQELTFHPGNDRQNARSPLAQAALKLNLHETSSIIEENGSLNILNCIKKVEPDSHDMAYEEIKEQVLRDYINNKYEELIRKRLSEVQIVMNPSFL